MNHQHHHLAQFPFQVENLFYILVLDPVVYLIDPVIYPDFVAGPAFLREVPEKEEGVRKIYAGTAPSIEEDQQAEGHTHMSQITKEGNLEKLAVE